MVRAPLRAEVVARAESLPARHGSASPAELAPAPEARNGAGEPTAARTRPEAEAHRVPLRGRVVERGTGRALGGLGLGLAWLDTPADAAPGFSFSTAQLPLVPLRSDGSFELAGADPARTLTF